MPAQHDPKATRAMLNRIRARGKRAPHLPGQMNRLERDYANTLDIGKLAGSVLYWHFEAFKFQLAKKTWFMPDFWVVTGESFIEIHEVKGHWEDDARVKIKVAAKMYPYFTFRAISRGKDQNGVTAWIEEIILL